MINKARGEKLNRKGDKEHWGGVKILETKAFS